MTVLGSTIYYADTMLFAFRYFTSTSFKALFVQTGRQHLTSVGVLKMFSISWSPTGRNRRQVEEEVILNFTYYLSELEGMWFGFAKIIVNIQNVMSGAVKLI